MNDELQDIKISMQHNKSLTEQCIKSNEKISNTLDELKDIITVLADNIKQNNKIVNELAINVRTLNNKLYNNKKINNKNNIFDYLRRTYKALLFSIYQ